ncbi:hypothetical protein Droror1_Dr00018029 [Drosera rotundifolia]
MANEISVGDMMEMIKGFVDMLILASGYQSSGLAAHWDSSNIKNAFKWGLLLENVLKHLDSSPDCREFIAELDEGLSEMKASPTFPLALSGVSSGTFARARALLAEHMIQALPLGDEQLIQLMMAATEMDQDKFQGNESDSLNLYLDKLMLLRFSFSVFRSQNILLEVPSVKPPNSGGNMEIGSCTSCGTTELAIEELLQRQPALSFLLRAETSLDIVKASISSDNLTKRNYSFYKGQLNHDTPARCQEQSNHVIWKLWRSKNLSYFLDKKTIKLVSGATLIFSTKDEGSNVFRQLNISSEVKEDALLEIVEIMLLGCISSRWEFIVQSFLVLSNDFPTISNQMQEIYNVLQERSQSCLLDQAVKSKADDILMYLVKFVGLGTLASLLLKMPPALVAVAVPFGSPLFRLHLTEIENQLNVDYSTIRSCTCAEERREHISCELILIQKFGALAERIWCLNAFHVRCGISNSMQGTGTF